MLTLFIFKNIFVKHPSLKNHNFWLVVLLSKMVVLEKIGLNSNSSSNCTSLRQPMYSRNALCILSIFVTQSIKKLYIQDLIIKINKSYCFIKDIFKLKCPPLQYLPVMNTCTDCQYILVPLLWLVRRAAV